MTYREIISRWPNIAEFAADIGVPEKTAAQMRWRNRIAPRHWLAMVSAAERRGIDGVTLRALAGLAAAEDDAA